jgi:hypothetical protein
LWESENGKVAAVEHENARIDPDLQAIIERWPDLPDAVKASIVAMVTAARRDGAEG